MTPERLPQLNCVHCFGRLTADPELRVKKGVDGGDRTCEYVAFTVAVRYSFKRSGKEHPETRVDFVPCVIFGPRAVSLSEQAQKGSGVFVVGRLTQDSWEKDGVKHSRIYVTAEQVQVITKIKQREEPHDRPEA